MSTTSGVDTMDAEIRAFAATREPRKRPADLDRARRELHALPFDKAASSRSRRAAEKLGYSHMHTVSGAGHDAVYMARASLPPE